MLELKNVTYDYLAMVRNNISVANYQVQKIRTFYSIIGQSGLEINPPLPLGWSGQLRRVRFSLRWEVVQTKVYTTAAFWSSEIQSNRYSTPLENGYAHKQAGKRFSWDQDESINQTQCPAIIWRTTTAGGHCACDSFQKHLSSWRG